MNKRLSVVIPFLNEGHEIVNTVRSVRQTAGDAVQIITINDGSNTLFDYESLLAPYHVIYHKNKVRIGVSACRDMGVKMCDTPYFLFLDGHMRFYSEDWAEKLVSLLEEDDRRLLCCQTKSLLKDEDGSVIEKPKARIPKGAKINFSKPEALLEAEWVYHTSSEYRRIETI